MKEYSILTTKEQKTYDFIIRYSKKYGKYPLLIEIAKGIGITSKGVAHRYVKSLEKELTLLKAELSKVKAATPPPPKEEQVCVGDVCMMVTPPSNEKEAGTEDEEDMDNQIKREIEDGLIDSPTSQTSDME